MSDSSNTNEFPPQYDPQAVEARLYQTWLEKGYFTADPDSSKPKYVIVQPPPNVTGVLHMGHALTCTLEDILVRRKRMQGFNTLWLPGTDHAGIATQMVVERTLLKEEKKNKHDLGREKFLERVWQWKEQSQGTILSQMKVIGCSVDWTRLRFTLDDGASRAVREAFVRLYNEKLLTRQEAMIQWCPRCRTALSDLEVKAKEVKGNLWRIRYCREDKPTEFLIVATTRPETLLGDVAVAVHPNDERYTSFHGKKVLVPLANRAVPVITDAYVDPAFGTGALKITPGHDPNDYEIGKRHHLSVLSILDDKAGLIGDVGAYAGLSREKAREKILEDLKAQDLLEGVEPYSHNVGHCDRCATVVEPRVSHQWFVNAHELAQPAIRAVENKEIRIIPEEWEKTYFEWMRNIRPWCVSRQLWWGHRIPVWYCQDCKEMNVATEAPERCGKCKSVALVQDPDVLDTWFSSGLWPFSTLGWPDATNDMKAFYPGDVLETGFDILFFWVARMIMMGMRMTGQIPFHTVYLHPMVRDEFGQKMSKTKNNVKDPLDFIHRMGADPLRFTLAAMAVHGRDVLLSDSRIEGYRNFVNKIWNAARFVSMHFGDVKKSNIDESNEVNRWIWTRLNDVKKEVNAALEAYRFFEAANTLYAFVWNEYCDWFIEFIKHKDEMEARTASKESTAVEVLEEILRLLHPLMPFVTEELWQRLAVKAQAPSIVVAPYPEYDAKRVFPDSEQRVSRMIRVVEALRSKRGECNLSPASLIRVELFADEKVLADLRPFHSSIEQLAKTSSLKFSTGEGVLKGNVLIPLDDARILVPREDLLNVEAEQSRVQKELESIRGEWQRANEKLASTEFREKAPPSVVEGVEARKLVLESTLTSLEAYLKELQS